MFSPRIANILCTLLVYWIYFKLICSNFLTSPSFTEEAIERTTYTTILALTWFWQLWNWAWTALMLNPLMCPMMPLGWLWRASKSIKVSFCIERMNYWKGDFYIQHFPNQHVLYKSPLVSYLFIEVNRKRNKRRLYQ